MSPDRHLTPGARSRMVVAMLATTVAVLGAMGRPAVALPPTPACSSLTVVPAAVAGQSGGQIFATAPQALSRLDLPASAFTAARAGAAVPLTAQPLAGPGTAVALVLAADTTTPTADYSQARIAAHELLLALPEGARSSLVTGSGPAQVLSPLSADRALTAGALSRLDRPGGGRSTAQAVLLAAEQLPKGGHVVLLADAAGDGDLTAQYAAEAALTARAVTLDRITYGPDSDAAAATGAVLVGDPCTASTAAQPILVRVDTVAARLHGEYQLNLRTPNPAGVTVRLAADGISEKANLTAPDTAATPPAGPPAQAVAPPTDGREDPPGTPISDRLIVSGMVTLLLGAAARALVRQRRHHRTAGTNA